MNQLLIKKMLNKLVTPYDLAKHLKISHKIMDDKIKRKRTFTHVEAHKIRLLLDLTEEEAYYIFFKKNK